MKRLAPAAILLTAAALHAQTPTVQQTVAVTTTRSSVELGATANTTSTLSADDLTQYPALTLDERLRQHAGFELFRRSSTWVANPTSEGISLRGLGSTAASRTLVLSSGVPLNDPFGGWIHWTEFPPETIEAVTLASGGGSDLYGSSALGGVIDVVPAIPTETLLAADLAGASEDTSNLSARGDTKQNNWHELFAAQSFRTAGYITTAPAIRGKVDIPSNVHFENGRIELDRALGRTSSQTSRAFVIGNLLNEARANGTPDQTNGTRLWRTILGDDWQARGPLADRLNGRVRLFGSDEAYRQSFSSINATRSAETLTRPSTSALRNSAPPPTPPTTSPTSPSSPAATSATSAPPTSNNPPPPRSPTRPPANASSAPSPRPSPTAAPGRPPSRSAATTPPTSPPASSRRLPRRRSPTAPRTSSVPASASSASSRTPSRYTPPGSAPSAPPP